MIRILCTSDWHLDTVTAGLVRFDDLCCAVGETITAAVEQKCDLYLFLGDLCDPDAARAGRCVSVAIRAARQLWFEHGIPSRWLVGNHDVIDDGNGGSTLEPLSAASEIAFACRRSMPDGLPSLEPFVVYSRPTAELLALPTHHDTIERIRIVALPYTPRVAAYDPIEFVKNVSNSPAVIPHVVMAHLNVPGVLPASETHEMPRGRDVWLPDEVIAETYGEKRVVLNGHYHQHQITPSGVIIPGALDRLTFGEADNMPGFLVVEVPS